MRVCDICRKELEGSSDIDIRRGCLVDRYEVCEKCAKKIVRCIKYMRLMNDNERSRQK